MPLRKLRCLTQEEGYALACYRYIELNPVRAWMVGHPAEYRWSSLRVNAQGEASTLLTPHDIYKRLGFGERSRQKNYRELFRYHLDSEIMDEIRSASNGNFSLGSDIF